MSSQISRRRFVVAAGSATAASALVPNSVIAKTVRARTAAFTRGDLATGSFPFGVVSGEPTTGAITLCTTVQDYAGTGGIAVEISTSGATSSGGTSDSFGAVLQSTALAHDAGQVYTIDGHARQSFKTTISGLAADTLYYYRFVTKDNYSRVGRFRTAPLATSTRAIKYAFFSCQDYTFGWYNAHAAMAKENLDFVVNLGDYIYAESYHSTSESGVRNDGIGVDTPYGSATYKVALTVDDYRAKYDLYRTDPDLQDMHANFAMYSTWDDHEVQDNYAGGAGPDGGLPSVRQNSVRQVNGYKAFFEKMPTANQTPGSATESRIYRSIRYGKHVELFMLDQRQYRDDQPDGDPGTADPTKWADYNNTRKFLGDAQLAWFKTQLKASTATWKVVANEVMIMNTRLSADSWYNFDSWQGYPTERADIVKYIRDQKIKNVVFCTGDIHTFAAGDVVVDPTQVKKKPTGGGKTVGKNSNGKPVATEFVAGSISSQGLGDGGLLSIGIGSKTAATDLYPVTDPFIYGTLFTANAWLANGDTDHHGYGRVTAGRTGFTCDLRRVTGVKDTSSKSRTVLPLKETPYNKAKKKKPATNKLRHAFSWTVKPGSVGLL